MSKTHFNIALLNDIIMIILAVVSVGLFIFDSVALLLPEEKVILYTIDIIIAFAFLIEFIIHFMRAKKKHRFFARRGWELLAVIPIFTPLRGAQIIRLLPLLRFLRLAHRIRLFLITIRWYSRHTYITYVITIVISVVLLGAVGFHYFEFGHNSHVHSFFDSTWWAIVTTATIGYGDIYPVTVGGRIIAIFLIFIGIGTFGALIGAIDQYVLMHNRRLLFKTQGKRRR